MIKDILGKIFVDSCILFLGFLVGRFTANKLSHRTEVTQTFNQQTNTAQVSSIIENKAGSSQDDNTSYTEKFFNKRGILIHEIEKKHENRASELSFAKHADLSIASSTVTNTTSTNIETSYQSNWTIGFFVPFKLHPEFQEVDAQIQYRLLGPVYLAAQTNYKFTKPMVGFLINF